MKKFKLLYLILPLFLLFFGLNISKADIAPDLTIQLPVYNCNMIDNINSFSGYSIIGAEYYVGNQNSPSSTKIIQEKVCIPDIGYKFNSYYIYASLKTYLEGKELSQIQYKTDGNIISSTGAGIAASRTSYYLISSLPQGNVTQDLVSTETHYTILSIDEKGLNLFLNKKIYTYRDNSKKEETFTAPTIVEPAETSESGSVIYTEIDPSWYNCQTNTDCIKVSDACGCTMGGTNRVINSMFLNEYNNYLSNGNNDLVCAAVISNNPTCSSQVSTKCMGGKCTIDTGSLLINIFPDVFSTNDNYDAVSFLKTAKIVQGYADGSYKPDNLINRAEFLKILFGQSIYADEVNKCIEKNAKSNWDYIFFKDVPIDAWYAKYVCYGKDKGYINGYPDDTFKPGNMINFAEISKIVSLVLAIQNEFPEGLDDVWYHGPIEWLAGKNAIPTSIVTEGVGKNITRGEMAEILYRIMASITNKSSLKYDDLIK